MALTESLPESNSDRSALFAERQRQYTVVWLRGEHDVSTRSELSRDLARAIALDSSDVVVDLSDVRFMDASTIGVIVAAREFLRARWRSLTVRSPSECAGRILDLCDLTDLLDPSPGEVAAEMASVGGALGTWVPVPAAARVDQPAGPVPMVPDSSRDRGHSDITTAVFTRSWSGDRERSERLAVHPAGHGRS